MSSDKSSCGDILVQYSGKLFCWIDSYFQNLNHQTEQISLACLPASSSVGLEGENTPPEGNENIIISKQERTKICYIIRLKENVRIRVHLAPKLFVWSTWNRCVIIFYSFFFKEGGEVNEIAGIGRKETAGFDRELRDTFGIGRELWKKSGLVENSGAQSALVENSR
jgi:hypothetical protein